MKGRKVQEDLELRALRHTFAANQKILVKAIGLQVCLLCLQLSRLEPFKPLIMYAAFHSIAMVAFECWADDPNYQVVKARLEAREYVTSVACLFGRCVCSSWSSLENEALMAFAALVLFPAILVALSEDFGPPSQLSLLLHFLMACARFSGDLSGSGGQQILGLLAFHAVLFKVGIDRKDGSQSKEVTGSILGALSCMLSLMADGFFVVNEQEKIVGVNEGVDICLGTGSGPEGSELRGKAFSSVFQERPRCGLNSTWFTRADKKRIKLEMYTVPCQLSAEGVLQVLETPPRRLEAAEGGASICALRIIEEEKHTEPEPASLPSLVASDLTQLRLEGLDRGPNAPVGGIGQIGQLGGEAAAPAASQPGPKTLAPLFFKSPWRFESLSSGALPSKGANRLLDEPITQGQGGASGSLYVAENKSGERVAIKEMSLAGMNSQQDFAVHLKSMSREADALKKISWASPVVIRLIDCWLQNDFNKACIVMEWLPKTMEGVLNKFRDDKLVSVGKQDAWRWFTHMVAGVTAVHAAGFVHRDIKPSNIWMTADNSRCKIAGLGISRPLRRRSACSSKTRRESFNSMGSSFDADDTESAVGSTLSEDNGSMISGFSALTAFSALNGINAYSSPEMVRERRSSERTDIFSLGCIMLEILTLAPLADLRIGAQEETSPEELAWSLVADTRVRSFDVADVQSLSVNSGNLPGLAVSMLSFDPAMRPTASDIVGRCARLHAYLPELFEESPKLRGVLLKQQRRVHFNPGTREQDDDDQDGAGSDQSSSELMPAVA